MTIDHLLWLVLWGAVTGLSLRSLSVLSLRWFGAGYSPVEWSVVVGGQAFFLAGFRMVQDWRSAATVVGVLVVGSFLRKALVHWARLKVGGAADIEGDGR